MTLKVYIAGPITGLKDYNHKSFELAEKHLKAKGYEVRNPACLPTDWNDYTDYTTVTLAMLSVCDCIVFLPGSDKSKGAEIERVYANENEIPKCDWLREIWPDLVDEYYRAKETTAPRTKYCSSGPETKLFEGDGTGKPWGAP